MSDDKKKYWDEIEQQLNKVTEERQKLKETFNESRQRKSHKKSSKKGKRSKQYAQDEQVKAAIAAVEALTLKKEETGGNSFADTSADSMHNEHMTDTGSMIMLGPEFPLEKFDELVAQKEAVEQAKPKETIVLGAPVPVDEGLLKPIEKTVKEKTSKEQIVKKKTAKGEKSAKNATNAETKKSKMPGKPVVQKQEEKKKQEMPEKTKKQERKGQIAAIQVSARLDQVLDDAVAGFKKTMQMGYRMIRPDTEQKLGGRYFGRESFEKVMQRRKALVLEQYQITRDRSVILGAKYGERFALKEEKVAAKAAAVVERADIAAAKMSDRVHFVYLSTGHKLQQFEEWAKNNKELLFRGFTGAVVTTAVVALIIGQMSAYEYMYNGKVLGVVKNQDDVYKTINVIGSKMGDAYGAQIEIDKEHDITFRRVIGLNQRIDSTDEILNSLSYMRDVKAKAIGIFVGGKQQVIVQNREIANQILEAIKGVYSPTATNVTYDKVGFVENVKLKEVETKLGNIQNEMDAINYMLTGAVEKTVHEVVAGQTFSGIAKLYGLKQSELHEMNPTVIPEKLKIGQELYLNKDRPVVTVQTEETVAYSAPLEYQIVYENTTTLFKGEQTVKLQGSNGEQAVVAKIIRENGVEVGREIVSSQVVSQPVNQIVLMGTKPAPKLVGTGTYQYPVRGARLTSKFGSRWGRTHYGIDLACSTGTKIGASDGGTVTFAGYKGSFGYLVIINHGGGRETYYAHCSKLFVSKGQKVYQGQHIANVGNTGRSTGPHVHFEVHINGTAKNPLNYL